MKLSDLARDQNTSPAEPVPRLGIILADGWLWTLQSLHCTKVMLFWHQAVLVSKGLRLE